MDRIRDDAGIVHLAGGRGAQPDLPLLARLALGWKLRDRTAGRGGLAVDWRFTAWQRVKIRPVNEMDSDHPMHHRSTSPAPAAS